MSPQDFERELYDAITRRWQEDGRRRSATPRRSCAPRRCGHHLVAASPGSASEAQQHRALVRILHPRRVPVRPLALWPVRARPCRTTHVQCATVPITPVLRRGQLLPTRPAGIPARPPWTGTLGGLRPRGGVPPRERGSLPHTPRTTWSLGLHPLPEEQPDEAHEP